MEGGVRTRKAETVGSCESTNYLNGPFTFTINQIFWGWCLFQWHFILQEFSPTVHTPSLSRCLMVCCCPELHWPSEIHRCSRFEPRRVLRQPPSPFLPPPPATSDKETALNGNWTHSTIVCTQPSYQGFANFVNRSYWNVTSGRFTMNIESTHFDPCRVFSQPPFPLFTPFPSIFWQRNCLEWELNP